MYLAPRRCHKDNSSSNQRLLPSNMRLCICSSFSKAYPPPFQHSEHLDVSYHEINSILSSECVWTQGVHVCAFVFMCVHMPTVHMRSTSDVFLSCSPSHYFETESPSSLLFPTAVTKSPAKAT